MPTRPQEWEEGKWKSLIKSVVRHTVQEDESVDDVVAGGWALGKYRGRVIGRDFAAGEDVPFGLSIFCLYPFKPPVSQHNFDYLVLNRWKVFGGAEHDDDPERRFVEVVPEGVLRLDLHKLFGLLQVGDMATLIKFPD